MQDTVRQTTVASSVVGTYGYMSPEQLRGGKTYLSTDLYGLGASLIYMLTGKHPSQLPRKRLKIDFHQQVDISTELRGWIDKLIEPHPQNRFPSAQVALDVLRGKTKLTEFNSVLEKPSYSSVKLVRTPEQLEIAIPSALNRKRWNYYLGLVAIGGYGMVLMSFLIVFSLVFVNHIAIILSFFIYGFLLISQIFFTARNIVLKIAILITTLWVSLTRSIVIVNYDRISNFLRDYDSTEMTTLLPLIVFAICLLILLIEIFWSDRLYQLIRYLLLDTLLTIRTDRKKNYYPTKITLGADVNARDIIGLTPFDVTDEMAGGNEKIKELLKKHGAK